MPVIPANSPGGQRVLGPGTVSLTLLGDRLSLQAEQGTWVSQGQGRLGEPWGFGALRHLGSHPECLIIIIKVTMAGTALASQSQSH